MNKYTLTFEDKSKKNVLLQSVKSCEENKMIVKLEKNHHCKDLSGIDKKSLKEIKEGNVGTHSQNI